ncbi:hypothetical protein [Leifsonia sp. Root227]|uniref:hypothetical protein n=1 Tax=Leifsonia sp. Root227 TaxID=1736496 RepID=UPI000B1B41A1|nr:hypothetical protein [Leifsonia sp. Root227]
MSDVGQLGLVRTVGFSSWLIRLVTKSHYNHVILRFNSKYVVSAETSGVAILPTTHFPNAVWSQFPLDALERRQIVAFALNQVHKPYGRLTFVWIGISRITRWATPRWLEKRINNEKTWVCSALADSAYTHAGIHLFRDRRPPGAVTPGDLAQIFYDFHWVDRA